MYRPHFHLDVHKGGGADSTNTDKGREDVKNPQIFANIINGSFLWKTDSNSKEDVASVKKVQGVRTSVSSLSWIKKTNNNPG